MTMQYPETSTIAVMILAGVLTACGGAVPYQAPADAPRPHTIYVINYAWHTGIAIAREDLPAATVPEVEDFPEATYLEFGWGDREYYPARDPGIGQALVAGLVPTSSVIQVVGLPRSPTEFYPASEVHALSVTTAGLENLITQIDAMFDRPNSRAEALYITTTERTRFYPAHGRFHLFNTCNTWTARKLAAAGLSVAPGGVVTAEQLMRRVRDLDEGVVVSAGIPARPD